MLIVYRISNYQLYPPRQAKALKVTKQAALSRPGNSAAKNSIKLAKST